jgi:hypothetical protein
VNVSEVAIIICTDLGLSGDYWPILTQTFINLTRSIRNQIFDFLNGKIAYLEIYKAQLVTFSQKGDVLGRQLQIATAALNQILAPVENILNVIPLEAVGLQEIPEVADLLKNITESVPLQIPQSVATSISGLAGFDLLEGVNTFGDLKDKIEELGFRAARATSLSNYAGKGSSVVDGQIDKLRNILSIISEVNLIGT